MKRTIALLLALCMAAGLCGCGSKDIGDGLGNGWLPEKSMELDYATEFSVDYYPGGHKLISLADGSRFITVPEGAELPEDIAPDIKAIYQPLDRIYLAASAAMCLYDALGCLDSIRLTSTKAENWHIEAARKAMEQGKILYAGKYSQPDYELLLTEGTALAIESLMIGHASGVREKLEELGILVLVDQSSMESHPLGRTEWIKLYGALMDREEEAEALFDRQKEYLQAVSSQEASGKTVAFFHINSSGQAVVRKSDDYVSKMLGLAGGVYIFDDIGDPELRTSTEKLEMEEFFATAKDADYIIYNSTLGGEIKSLDQLIEKAPLLAEFSAVKEGRVWCSESSMYQQTTQLGQMIQSFQQIFSGAADDLDTLPFLYRLK